MNMSVASGITLIGTWLCVRWMSDMCTVCGTESRSEFVLYDFGRAGHVCADPTTGTASLALNICSGLGCDFALAAL